MGLFSKSEAQQVREYEKHCVEQAQANAKAARGHARAGSPDKARESAKKAEGWQRRYDDHKAEGTKRGWW